MLFSQSISYADGSETNKFRTFLRYIFSLGIFITGVDGLAAKPVIALNPLALDILTTVLTLAFNVVLMVSVMVALPRQYGPSGAKVMVGFNHGQGDDAAKHGVRRGSNPFRRLASDGQHDAAGNGGPGTASQFALMTLLREGGQWEGEADIIQDLHAPTATADEAERSLAGTSDRVRPFAGGRVATNDSRAGLIDNTKAWDGEEEQAQLPPAVSDTSLPH